ncbi:hypothetical protein D3C84_450100 [compost metagenome]
MRLEHCRVEGRLQCVQAFAEVIATNGQHQVQVGSRQHLVRGLGMPRVDRGRHHHGGTAGQVGDHAFDLPVHLDPHLMDAGNAEQRPFGTTQQGHGVLDALAGLQHPEGMVLDAVDDGAEAALAARRVDHAAADEVALQAQVRGHAHRLVALVDQGHANPHRRTQGHFAEQRADFHGQAVDLGFQVGRGDARRAGGSVAERHRAGAHEGVWVVAQLLEVVGVEGPLDVAGEGRARGAGGGDDIAGAHEAVVGEVVVQAHGMAQLMHRGAEVGRCRRAEALAADGAPARIDDPVGRDAEALARHIVGVGAGGVVHDPAWRGVDVFHRKDVITPFAVEVDHRAPGEHRRVHLGVGPGCPGGFGHVGVAEVHRGLPADRIHHGRPGVADATVGRPFRAAHCVDLDRAAAEVAGQPAHGQAPDHGIGGILHIAFGVVGRRGVARRRRHAHHLRGEGGFQCPAVGRGEAVELEGQAEAVAQVEVLRQGGDADVVAIARAPEDRDAGGRVGAGEEDRLERQVLADTGLALEDREGRGDRYGQENHRPLVEVAAGGAPVAVALHPQGPVVGHQGRAAGLVVQQPATGAHAAKWRQGYLSREGLEQVGIEGAGGGGGTVFLAGQEQVGHGRDLRVFRQVGHVEHSYSTKGAHPARVSNIRVSYCTWSGTSPLNLTPYIVEVMYGV